MSVIIVGGKGMLGTDIAQACVAQKVGFEICDLPEFDICNYSALVEKFPNGDCVLNCAAYTKVDEAEKERDLCRAINVTGAANVARVCAARKMRLIHISTDYVFDGTKGTPYVESDPVAPLNWYGRTKLDGELKVLDAYPDATIVRTQSLYGLNGRNFIKAILGQIHKGSKELRVVDDQVSSPTYTKHLAGALLNLSRVKTSGLVNVACTGGCSWFDFALAVVDRVGAIDVAVHPRSSAELKFPAPRPAFSVLDTTRYTQLTGSKMPTWEQGLDAYLKEEPLAKL